MMLPRLVVAAPHGRSGKTTLTIGLVAALAARGMAVQPFKKGPDYIDPGWLSDAAGRPCRNLDLYMMGDGEALGAFRRGMEGAEIAVVEGAMGLYDGLDLEGSGSTAQLARLLAAPILLVVDATRMTRSVAALVSGFQHFEPGVHIAGVVLNSVARPRHEEMLVRSIEHYCGVPVLGSIPRSESLTIPDRHLGLVPAAEDPTLLSAIADARRIVEERLDLDRILAVARSAPDLALGEPDVTRARECRARIAVLLDRVFTFYYPENLEALGAAGAELEFVDSLSAPALPEVDGLYVGGGFPELFMEQLEANESLRRDIRGRIDAGLPVYAECAGLIYLSRRVRSGGRSAEMVGVLPCEIEMTGKPQGHGYVLAEAVADTHFFRAGDMLRGHEFHNTRVSMLDGRGARFAYRLQRGAGIDGDHNDGLMVGNVLAAYTHLHALAAPRWAEGFLEAAEEYHGFAP